MPRERGHIVATIHGDPGEELSDRSIGSKDDELHRTPRGFADGQDAEACG
jgi:hypothetical protein